MAAKRFSGFEEVAHTADLALHVWAPDAPGLLRTAALGMYGLMGVQFAEGALREREFELHGGDLESQMVAFLSELLYYHEQEGIGFCALEFDFAKEALLVRGVIRQVTVRVRKEIKAVTYHNLRVHHTASGLETTIVFDV